MDGVSAAGSVISVVQVGLQLAQTLYKFASDVKDAEKDVKAIAQDVRLTTIVLKHTHDQVQANAKLYTENAVKDFDQVLEGCHDAFREVDRSLAKLRTSENGAGKPSVSLAGKLKWGFSQKKKVELLRANLEKLKATLLVMLNVFSLSRMIDPASAGHNIEKVEVEKLQIESLVKAKDSAAQKYEELVLSFAKLETRINNTARPGKCGAKEALKQDSHVLSGRLGLCIAAVERLSDSIDTAASCWLDKRLFEIGGIRSGLLDATREVHELGSCIAIHQSTRPHAPQCDFPAINAGHAAPMTAEDPEWMSRLPRIQDRSKSSMAPEQEDGVIEAAYSSLSVGDLPRRDLSRKRTKTGCLTCRKRRIKCDESRPVCSICTRSRRRCEGYNQRVVFKPGTSESNTIGATPKSINGPSIPSFDSHVVDVFDMDFSQDASELDADDDLGLDLGEPIANNTDPFPLMEIGRVIGMQQQSTGDSQTVLPGIHEILKDDGDQDLHRPRKRPALACATCRTRRIKCGKERPEYSQCLQSGIRCGSYHGIGSRRPSQGVEPADGPMHEGLAHQQKLSALWQRQQRQQQQQQQQQQQCQQQAAKPIGSNWIASPGVTSPFDASGYGAFSTSAQAQLPGVALNYSQNTKQLDSSPPLALVTDQIEAERDGQTFPETVKLPERMDDIFISNQSLDHTASDKLPRVQRMVRSHVTKRQHEIFRRTRAGPARGDQINLSPTAAPKKLKRGRPTKDEQTIKAQAFGQAEHDDELTESIDPSSGPEQTDQHVATSLSAVDQKPLSRYTTNDSSVPPRPSPHFTYNPAAATFNPVAYDSSHQTGHLSTFSSSSHGPSDVYTYSSFTGSGGPVRHSRGESASADTSKPAFTMSQRHPYGRTLPARESVSDMDYFATPPLHSPFRPERQDGHVMTQDELFDQVEAAVQDAAQGPIAAATPSAQDSSTRIPPITGTQVSGMPRSSPSTFGPSTDSIPWTSAELSTRYTTAGNPPSSTLIDVESATYPSTFDTTNNGSNSLFPPVLSNCTNPVEPKVDAEQQWSALPTALQQFFASRGETPSSFADKLSYQRQVRPQVRPPTQAPASPESREDTIPDLPLKMTGQPNLSDYESLYDSYSSSDDDEPPRKAIRSQAQRQAAAIRCRVLLSRSAPPVIARGTMPPAPWQKYKSAEVEDDSDEEMEDEAKTPDEGVVGDAADVVFWSGSKADWPCTSISMGEEISPFTAVDGLLKRWTTVCA